MNDQIRFDLRETSVGIALIAINGQGVCGIYLGEEVTKLTDELRSNFPGTDIEPIEERQQDVVGRVLAFIQNPLQQPDLPLDIRGGDFEQMIWASLRLCPPGKTLTPAAVAQLIGASPAAAANVEQVCRRNKLAIVVPCHRVVASDGAFSVCRWGGSIQRALLSREQAAQFLSKTTSQ